MGGLDISGVARQAGIPPSTLRYYGDKGLMRSGGRRGLRGQVDPAVLEQLELIGLGRIAGFSLNEIAQMFGADGQPAINRDQLAAKAEELDTTIRRLTTMRDGLRHAAACPAPSHMECPKFRRILRSAGRRKQ